MDPNQIIQELQEKLKQSERETEKERREKEREREEKEEERREKELAQQGQERERQEKERERQEKEVAQQELQKSRIETFLIGLSRDLLAVGSSSRSQGTTLCTSSATIQQLFAFVQGSLSHWNDFQALWNDTVGSLPLNSPEPLLQEQFRLFFMRFLSKHGDVHLVDFSRSGLYGLIQRVDLLFCRGRVARRLATYFESCLVGELKASGRGRRPDAKLEKAVQQVYQRFAHIVEECGIRRRSYWGFACNRTSIVFLHLRILPTRSGWDYDLLQSSPVALDTEGLRALCMLLSFDSHTMCSWDGEAPPVVSAASSAIVSSLRIASQVELSGMLQRGPVHGVGEPDAVEVATGVVDQTTAVVVKSFPPSKQGEMETERSVLLEISRIDWDAHKYWVPSLVLAEQSERGGILCTTPVGNPLPLASCFSEHAMLYCAELLLQLTSIVSNYHEKGVHHMDICPQNIVLLDEQQTAVRFPICLIDWGGASFMQKLDKKEFHYHTTFSPDWLDAVASLADLSDGERLQVCLQQAMLTTMCIAFGDVLSWLPPMAIILDEKNLQQDSHSRVRTKDDLFKIRREIITHLLDTSLDTPVLAGRDSLRLFFQQLRDAVPTLFELEERSIADNAMAVRIREFCADVCGRQFAELPAQ
eukprot:ANDGO_04721.mRNA.1 hypothetical protein